MTTKQAIVLLYPPKGDISSHNPSLLVIERALLNCCQKANISVLRIITATDAYDIDALRQFILAAKDHNEPVTLVINKAFRTSFHYLPIWCTIGALSIAGLIDAVQVYNRWHLISNVSKKEIGSLRRNDVDLLAEGLAYFRDMGVVAE